MQPFAQFSSSWSVLQPIEKEGEKDDDAGEQEQDELKNVKFSIRMPAFNNKLHFINETSTLYPSCGNKTCYTIWSACKPNCNL